MTDFLLPPAPVPAFRRWRDLGKQEEYTASITWTRWSRLGTSALPQEHIVVMGGGLTGVDAAMGFLHMGKKVELVELAERLLVEQLDAEKRIHL